MQLGRSAFLYLLPAFIFLGNKQEPMILKALKRYFDWDYVPICGYRCVHQGPASDQLQHSGPGRTLTAT